MIIFVKKKYTVEILQWIVIYYIMIEKTMFIVR